VEAVVQPAKKSRDGSVKRNPAVRPIVFEFVLSNKTQN